MAPPLHIAHLINPFQPPPDSEWEYVEPITFASMQTAREQAKSNGDIQVDLLSAQFSEDHAAIPDYFYKTPDLERSVLDICPATSAPKYPLIGDLIAKLYQNSEAEYLVYTNIDIAVQPHFYEFIAEKARQGLKAFIINRRRIPDIYRKVDELPQMYADPGKPHPGFDCFVFHRSLYPKFQFAHVCVGIPFIGILTAQNLFAFGEPCELFAEEHLTFHIGEDVFKARHKELMQHNRKEFWKAIEKLWPYLDNRKWPYGNQWLPIRMVKWGLHPSLPIRLALKLEWRKWFGSKN